MKMDLIKLGLLGICLGSITVNAENYRRISVEEYRDKMKGGWVGQIVGVTWGAPTEFQYNDKIIPEDKVPVWEPGMLNKAFLQDDLYVEMTFLRTLEEYGLQVNIRQAGIDFANSKYALWCANKAGRENLRNGIAPPDSSHPQFTTRANDIDYQIEADYAGLISPGMPNSVIRLGNIFGRLMNYGDGLYGGQFMGGMYAEAFFTADRYQIIRAGLACIPKESQYAEMVRDLLAWHQENPKDWQGCWRRCLKKYRKDPAYQKASNGAIDVKINGAMVLLGLLYGDGDLEKTTVIAMRGGYDSDCNPSSAAGPLFTSVGYSKLPERFRDGLDLKRKFNFTEYNVPGLLAVCEKLTRQILQLQGGKIEKDSNGKEFFLIPQKAPVPNVYECTWAPGPIANSKFTEEEKKKILELSERMKKLPLMQKAVGRLFPGWKTSPNGPDMNPGFYSEKLGEKNVLLTHPLKRGVPAILFREIKLPNGNPRLHLRLTNDPRGDFQLIVKVNNAIAWKDDIRGGKFRDLDIDLTPWAGKQVKIELHNQPTGWYCEAAYWSVIEIK